MPNRSPRAHVVPLSMGKRFSPPLVALLLPWGLACSGRGEMILPRVRDGLADFLAPQGVRVVIQRVTLDRLGAPPTVAEDPDRVAQLVDARRRGRDHHPHHADRRPVGVQARPEVLRGRAIDREVVEPGLRQVTNAYQPLGFGSTPQPESADAVVAGGGGRLSP